MKPYLKMVGDQRYIDVTIFGDRAVFEDGDPFDEIITAIKIEGKKRAGIPLLKKNIRGCRGKRGEICK